MELNIDKTGWKSYRFDEFAQNISQRVEPKQTDLEIYVGLEHLDPDSLHIKRNGTPADVEGTKLKFYKGDVIFGKRRAYQRKAALAETDGICSAHAMVLRANTKLIDERLFPFFFHSKVFQDIAVKISVGGLSPTINWKDLAKQEFLLPPKDQQARLAELLWAADEVVEREREVKERLEELYYSYISENILTNKGDKVKLSKLGQVIRGVSYKPEDLSTKLTDNEFVLLRSNNISNMAVNFKDINYVNRNVLNDKQILQSGDILICMSNGSKDLVGKAAEFVSSEYEKVSVGSFCAIFRPNKSLIGNLAKYLFQSETYRKHISLLISGSNINNLKNSDIESVEFTIKSGIAADNVLVEIKNIEKQLKNQISFLQKSEHLKQGLIYKIF